MKHTSIIQAVLSYQAEEPVSFHVPGHKNGRAYKTELPTYDFLDLDVTEIPGTDNLHHPEEAIRSVLDKAAKVYQSKSSYFLVNGTTGGNHAMILGTTRPGDKILIARNVHKSVQTACILGNLEPLYVYPEVHPDIGLPMGVTAEAIEAQLSQEKGIKAIVITSPTYEGVHSDIQAISEVARKYGVLLLVDEAHGAHVALNSGFGPSAISHGADVAVQSTHKSMRALTQASMLHVCTDRVPVEMLETWLSMLQSSSPSYVLLGSLEKSLDDFQNTGKTRAITLLQNLKELKVMLETRLGLKVLSGSDVEPFGFEHDPSKLVIFMKEADKLADQLRVDFNIQVEYATADFIVCVTSIWNTNEDFNKLFKALESLRAQYTSEVEGLLEFPVSKQAMTPNQAFYLRSVQIELELAINRVSGEYVIPYPPGIPILSPGEIITEEIVDLIYRWKSRGHAVIGVQDATLKTIKVIDKTDLEAK